MKQHMCENNALSLRDGRSVHLRPLTTADRRSLLAFGHALPSDNDSSFTDDWHNPEVVDWLIAATALEHWRQFVATSGDMIVGYGAVLRLPGVPNPFAEIYTIVSRGWQHSGLKSLLAVLLLDTARNLRAEKAVVELPTEQQSDRLVFERLGFRAEGTINAHLYAPRRTAYAELELERVVE